MKTDLFTSIVIFIVGAAVAFVATNMIVPGLDDFDIKTVNVNTNTSLTEPDIEVFNYRAINPTVEVYVGDGDDNVANPEDNPENAPEDSNASNENDTSEDDNNGATN